MNKNNRFFVSDPQYDFPASYAKIWDRAPRDKKSKIKALLIDYNKEDHLLGSLLGRICSLHWRRHHVSKMREILFHLHTRSKYESAEELLRELQLIKCVPGGSLDKRIRFIAFKMREREDLFNSVEISGFASDLT